MRYFKSCIGKPQPGGLHVCLETSTIGSPGYRLPTWPYSWWETCQVDWGQTESNLCSVSPWGPQQGRLYHGHWWMLWTRAFPRELCVQNLHDPVGLEPSQDAFWNKASGSLISFTLRVDVQMECGLGYPPPSLAGAGLQAWFHVWRLTSASC